MKQPKDCYPHNWQPLSFVFETQLLDDHGRVQVRQPDLEGAKVYCICLDCASWTYITTSWINFQLYGSEHREQEEYDQAGPYQSNRAGGNQQRSIRGRGSRRSRG